MVVRSMYNDFEGGSKIICSRQNCSSLYSPCEVAHPKWVAAYNSLTFESRTKIHLVTGHRIEVQVYVFYVLMKINYAC